MAHIKKTVKNRHEGKITYCDGIVQEIVFLAVSEVPYAELYSMYQRGKKRFNSINVDFRKEGISVDICVKIHFTQAVSDMAFKLQEAVRHNIESMTDYHVSNVNVHVNGMLFDDIALNDQVNKKEKVIENAESDKIENTVNSEENKQG